MKAFLLAMLPALFTSSCTQGPNELDRPADTGSAEAAAPADGGVPDVSVLAANHWRLSAAVDAANARIDTLFVNPEQPVQLDFIGGRLGVSNTCNRMSGEYSVNGSALVIGQMVSTMMACADSALMSLDREIGGRLEGSLSYAIRSADAGPQLILTGVTGDVLTFAGNPNAATRFGGAGERVFLEVAAQTRPCSHPLIPDYECLQVREIKFDEQGLRVGVPGEFEHFYEVIEGFSHTPGVRSVLRVQRYTLDPVPADRSATAYLLDFVVESEELRQ